MAEQQTQVNLSDDELRAALAAHLLDDPKVLARLDSDSRRRMSKMGNEFLIPVPPSETANPDEAKRLSRNETMGRTALGIGQGVLDTVNPLNMISGLAQGFRVMGGDPMASMEAGQGLIDTAKGIVSGNPDIGGRAIGALATALVAPKAGAAITPSADTKLALGNLLQKQPGIRLGNTPVNVALNPLAGVGRSISEAVDPLGLTSNPEAIAARARAAHTFPERIAPAARPTTPVRSQPTSRPLAEQMLQPGYFPETANESGRVGMPIRGATPEITPKAMADSIMEAAAAPGSSVKLNEWQQRFLTSIADQVKAGSRISPRQAQILAEMYSTFGLAK